MLLQMSTKIKLKWLVSNKEQTSNILILFLLFLSFNMQVCKLIRQEVNSGNGKGCTHTGTTVEQSMHVECVALQQEQVI